MLKELFTKYDFWKINEILDLIEPEIEGDINIRKRKLTSFWINIDATLKNGIGLKILINDAVDEDYIAFYFIKDDIRFEHIELSRLKAKRHANDYEFDWKVRHDYFKLDGDVATTFNSGYFYSDNKYLSGGQSIRKVYFEEISNFAGKDNLVNLSVTIDAFKQVLYKEEIEVTEDPVFKPVNLEYGKQNIKFLSKFKKV